MPAIFPIFVCFIFCLFSEATSREKRKADEQEDDASDDDTAGEPNFHIHRYSCFNLFVSEFSFFDFLSKKFIQDLFQLSLS